MARRVIFKENVLSQSPNPSGPYRFVGYDGLTFSQLDNSGNITPIGGGVNDGGVVVSNGLSEFSLGVIGLGGDLTQDTLITGTGLSFTMSSDSIWLTNGTSSVVVVGPNFAGVAYQYGDESHTISTNSDGISIQALGGLNNMVIESEKELNIIATSSNITTNDARGLVYTDDYSSTFVSYSLVTKGYVDAGTTSIFSTLSVNSYDYTEVNISSSQLLNIGSSPVQLLAAPGSNKYYDFDKIIFEFTYGTTTYNCPSKQFIIGYASPTIKIGYIDLSELVSQTINRICIVEPTKGDNYDIGGGVLVNTHISIQLNEALYFTTISYDDLTLGDGTMKVKIWYKVRNFG